jgi:hypothetical protein
MKKIYSVLITVVLVFFTSAVLFACPLCSDNVARTGNNGGMAMGIVITIFLLLGAVGSLAGFFIWLMIHEGRKSDRRHALAAQASQQA